MQLSLQEMIEAPADADRPISVGTEFEIINHFDAVRRELARVPHKSVSRLVQILRSARDRGSFVYILGNGGSASTASHWVNDLGKATKRSGQRPFKVMSLADNVSWFSALSNDEGYERSFAGQLENFTSEGDVLICISASGNSKNLVDAVELAKSRNVLTVGLLGFDGGVLSALVDHMVCIRSEKGAYELIEDVHMSICHAITRCLVADRARL